MSATQELSCSISGSFRKFKPEIDKLIDDFAELGVHVRAPAKGWLYKPHIIVAEWADFRPLPQEVGLSPRQIEDTFLDAIRRSDFLYLANPEGYMGSSASLEMGFALALGIPVFSLAAIDTTQDPDPFWKQKAAEVRVLSPEAVVSAFQAGIY
jgi:hypothetical protein